MEILNTIKDFIYSPGMIALQVFLGVVCVGLAIVLSRIVRDLDAVQLWWRFSRVSLKQGVEEQDQPPQVPESENKEDEYKEFYQNRWDAVVRKMTSTEPDQWKIAIIEADALLDYLLQHKGIAGSTMGDRLKHLSVQQFPFLESAWQVHRMRNYIVHDPAYQIDVTTAAQAFEIYRRIFIKEGVISAYQQTIANQHHEPVDTSIAQ